MADRYTKMMVSLLQYTPDCENIAALAAKLCYSPSSINDLISNQENSPNWKLLKKIVTLGHHSVLEHLSFTFGIEGISRVTSHQLVRHRVASYSQQSQRYVKSGETLDYIIPPSISTNDGILDKFVNLVSSLKKLYDEMIEEGIPLEDARYILPNAAETKIIVTMNARELRHFFQLRCCNRAQWEIREMAKGMLKLVKEKAAHIFSDAGPSCLRGPCQEGEMTCGKIEEVRQEFRAL